MERVTLDAVPFQHPKIDEWRDSFKGMAYLDKRTNLKITRLGG